jgi:VanZ family protein
MNIPMIPETSKNKMILSLVCLSIIILIFFFGLWPFNINPPNKVVWLKNEPGVRFSGPGHIYSPTNLGNDFFNRYISLEIWLRPEADPDNRYFRILSFWDGNQQEVFLIGQFKDELFLQVRSHDPKVTKGFRERGKEQTLFQGRKVLVTLTSSPEGTFLFENGLLSKTFPGLFLLEDWQEIGGKLILGNSPVGTSFWEGDILGLAFYNRPLSSGEVQRHYIYWIRGDNEALKGSRGLTALYPFNEQSGEKINNQANGTNPLLKPPVFHPLKKVILEWPTIDYMRSFSFYEDMLVNIFGFIPLGFFLSLWLYYFTSLTSTKSLILTSVLGFLISLTIDLAQVYLPGRDSSASDVLFNIIGTVIGLAVLRFFIIIKEKSF